MALTLIDRDFWSHPDIWRIPPVGSVKETFLPSLDFVIAAVNFGVNVVFFTFMQWEAQTGIGGDNHFLWPFVISSLISAAAIVDLGILGGVSDVIRSDAGVRSYVKTMVTSTPDETPHVGAMRLVIAKTVVPRVGGFARRVREVRLGGAKT